MLRTLTDTNRRANTRSSKRRVVRYCVGILVVVLFAGIGTGAVAAQGDVIVSPGDSIQNAVDRADPGDTVFVESGTYEQTVVIDKQLTIEGPDATLDGDSVGGTAVEINASGIEVIGLRILRYSDGVSIGPEGDDTELSDLELLSNGEGVVTEEATGSITVRDSAVRDNNGDGMSVTATDEVIVDGSEFNNNAGRFGGGIGLKIEDDAVGTPAVNITDSGFEGNGDQGMSVTSDDVEIVDVASIQNGGDGVEILSGSGEVTVRDSDILSNPRGIRIKDAEDVIIENTEVDGTSANEGILIDGDGPVGRTTVISGVSVASTRDEGISIRESLGTDNVEITESDFSGNANCCRSGVSVEADEVHIENISSTQYEGDGLEVFGDDFEVTIQDSSFVSNDGSGIRAFNAGDVVIKNTEVLEQNNEGGIRIHGDGPSGRTTNISDVSVLGNSGEGINIERTSGGTDEVNITNSIINNNGDVRANGIVMTVDKAEINNVSVSENGNGLSASSNEITIEDSEFISNDDTGFTTSAIGISVEDAEDVMIENSEVIDNELKGIRIDGRDGADLSATVNGVIVRDNGVGEDESGLFVSDSPGSDTLDVSSSEFTGNGFRGIDARAETVNIQDTVIQDNSDFGVTVGEEVDGVSGSTTNSILTGNGAGQIRNFDDTLYDATGNWWGSPDGPDDDDCMGEVDCSGHLTSPPGSATVTSSDVAIPEVGDTGESSITVDGGAGIGIAEIEISIDTTVAEIVNVEDGADVDPTDSAVTFDVVGQTADSVRVEYSSIQAQANPVQDFEVAVVEFEAQADEGESTIGLDTDELRDGNQNEYFDTTEDEGRVAIDEPALFPDPLPGFNNPPQNTGELNPTLYEDISGDGDGTDPTQAVTLWTELVLNPQDFDDLTQEQVDALDWNGDGQLTPADAVSLWTEQVLSS